MAQCGQCLFLSDTLTLPSVHSVSIPDPILQHWNKAKEPTCCLSISTHDSWDALVFYVEIKRS